MKHYGKWMPALIAGGTVIAGVSIVKVPITAAVQLPIWYSVAWIFGKVREQQGEIKGLTEAKQQLEEVDGKLKEILKQAEGGGARLNVKEDKV